MNERKRINKNKENLLNYKNHMQIMSVDTPVYYSVLMLGGNLFIA